MTIHSVRETRVMWTKFRRRHRENVTLRIIWHNLPAYPTMRDTASLDRVVAEREETCV
jgi:hypothetical protein